MILQILGAVGILAAILIGLGAFAVTPTLRFAIVLGACAFLALGIPRVALGAGAVVMLAFVVDAVLVRRRPEVERSMANVVVRGQASPITVDGDAPGALEIRQPLPAATTVTPETGPAPYDGRLTALRRGRMTLPPVATRVTGPLGLAAIIRSVGDGRDVLVYPDVPRGRELALQVRQGRFRDAGMRTRGPLGLGTDFESIRDYLPDDDLRQINWRATQRMGRPMSNVFRIEQDRDVMCVVDAGRLMAAPVGNGTNLDVAVDAAVAVALVADVVGDRCGLVAFDETVRRHLAPGRSGGDAVVRALVDLEPGESDSDYELAFRTIGRGKRAFVLVLTDLLDESAAASLLEAMPVLVRRHSVAVASARDGEVDRLLRTPPESRRDLFTASAAVHTLDARALVTAQLRRLGADVVEAPAELLGRACVAAYLRAKQHARV